MRVLTASLNKYPEVHATVVFINQEREKIGVTFGSNRTKPGGRSLDFYASTTLMMNRGQRLEREQEVADLSKMQMTTQKVTMGHKLNIKVTKDKSGGAMSREGAMNFWYDVMPRGNDAIEELFQLGFMTGMIKREGNTFIMKQVENADADLIRGTQGKFMTEFWEREDAQQVIADHLRLEMLKKDKQTQEWMRISGRELPEGIAV